MKYLEFITQHSDGSVVISLGADGASVMSGEYAGVDEILRSQHFLWILYIHCTAHRLNLIVNDLVKDSLLAVDVLATITRRQLPTIPILIISTISNYANEKTSFSQLACIRITNS